MAASTSRGVNTWICKLILTPFLENHLSKGSRVEKEVARLGDVGCMEVVVVLDILQVVVLQGHQEAKQGRSWDLEGAKEISLLQDSEKRVSGPAGEEKTEEMNT